MDTSISLDFSLVLAVTVSRVISRAVALTRTRGDLHFELLFPLVVRSVRKPRTCGSKSAALFFFF